MALARHAAARGVTSALLLLASSWRAGLSACLAQQGGCGLGNLLREYSVMALPATKHHSWPMAELAFQ